MRPLVVAALLSALPVALAQDVPDPIFEPGAKLTVLAAEARMPAAAVKKLVARVNAAASQSDALDIVEAERDARGVARVPRVFGHARFLRGGVCGERR